MPQLAHRMLHGHAFLNVSNWCNIEAVCLGRAAVHFQQGGLGGWATLPSGVEAWSR